MVEVPDIMAVRGGALRSLRGARVVKNGRLEEFGPGSGIRKNGEIYALGSAEEELETIFEFSGEVFRREDFALPIPLNTEKSFRISGTVTMTTARTYMNSPQVFVLGYYVSSNNQRTSLAISIEDYRLSAETMSVIYFPSGREYPSLVHAGRDMFRNENTALSFTLEYDAMNHTLSWVINNWRNTIEVVLLPEIIPTLTLVGAIDPAYTYDYRATYENFKIEN